jgi:hypothetical protein
MDTLIVDMDVVVPGQGRATAMAYRDPSSNSQRAVTV